MAISEKFPRNKLCADLIEPTTCRKDRPKFNTMSKPFSINPPAQKFYITYNKVMIIANLVDIFCMTEYIAHKSPITV